jgi:hypothetical protein
MSRLDQTRIGQARAGSRFPFRLLKAYIAVSAIFSILVFVNARITVDTLAGHDDGLFMAIGRHLSQGQWLGPFNQYTLMKGPGYPAFLAVANWFGLPLTLAHVLFLCTSIVFVVMLCRRFIRSNFVLAVLFTLLLWHPVFLTDPMLRVVRDFVFSLQPLIFVVALAWALLGATTARERAFYSLLSGMLLGWLWLTREEAVWIVPGGAVIFLAAAWQAWRGRNPRPLAWSSAIVLLSFAATQLAFEAVNWRVYGKFVGVDVKERNFQRALGALQSVRSGASRPFVAITNASMQKVYEVSPTFATLQPHFQGPVGKTWEQTSCHTLGTTCGDIGAGWFIWALRNVADAAGIYASPAKASAFFGQVADEIEAACASGRLECSSSLITVLPYYTWDQAAQFPSRFFDFFRLLLLLDRPQLNPGNSSGDPALLNEMMHFLHHPLRTPTNDEPPPLWTMHGWYYRTGDQWFSLALDDRATSRPVELDRSASADLVAHFNDPKANRQRFDFRFECTEDCIVRLTDADGVKMEKALSEFPRAPFRWRLKNAFFHIDRLQRSDAASTRSALQVMSQQTRSMVLASYNFAFIPALVLGICAFTLASIWHFRSALSNISYVIALSAWTLVVTRVGLLAFIDVTSFQVWSFKYMGPAYSLLVCAAILSISAWLQLSGVMALPTGLRLPDLRTDTITAIWPRAYLARLRQALTVLAATYWRPARSLLQRRPACADVVVCMLAGAAAAVWQGQDGNWDLLNYHLYNVFWLLEGRRHVDFVANGLHNFLSPLADIPFYYLAMKWLPDFPRAVAAIQGLYFGALIYVVLRINARVLPPQRFGFATAVIATVIGVTGAATFPEAGTTYNDIQVALLVLAGILVLLPLCEESADRRLTVRSMSAGVLCGAAGGVKLTAILFAPGVACAILLALPLRRSIAVVVLFSVGWCIGFALSYGWWGFMLWEMTGNPLFPFYNGIFRSDWSPPQNFGPHYGLTSWTALITYPFRWIRFQQELVTELPFRDARFAAAFLSILFLALAWLLRRRVSPPGDRAANPPRMRAGRFIIVYFLVTYAIWLPVSIALRYAVAIEVLTGTLMLLAASALAALLPVGRLRTVAAPLLGLLALAAFLAHTSYPTWARRIYGERVFSVRVPDMPPNSLVIVHSAPLAYLLPFITSPGWSAVHAGHFSTPGYRVFEETKRRVAAHTGPIFVIYTHLEQPWFVRTIDAYGVLWDRERCRPIESNMSWGLSLCDARKR